MLSKETRPLLIVWFLKDEVSSDKECRPPKIKMDENSNSAELLPLNVILFTFLIFAFRFRLIDLGLL